PGRQQVIGRRCGASIDQGKYRRGTEDIQVATVGVLSVHITYTVGVQVRPAVGQRQFVLVYRPEVVPYRLLRFQFALPPYQRHETEHNSQEKTDDQCDIFGLRGSE